MNYAKNKKSGKVVRVLDSYPTPNLVGPEGMHMVYHVAARIKGAEYRDTSKWYIHDPEFTAKWEAATVEEYNAWVSKLVATHQGAKCTC